MLKILPTPQGFLTLLLIEFFKPNLSQKHILFFSLFILNDLKGAYVTFSRFINLLNFNINH